MMQIYSRPANARRTNDRPTAEQTIALWRVFNRDAMSESWQHFRAGAGPGYASRTLMVPWRGMWLGIEPDGYTHS
jgi:hypothetical protein